MSQVRTLIEFDSNLTNKGDQSGHKEPAPVESSSTLDLVDIPVAERFVLVSYLGEEWSVPVFDRRDGLPWGLQATWGLRPWKNRTESRRRL